MSSLKLNKKIDEHANKIIEKLSEIKETVTDMSDEIKQQTIEYLNSLIVQVDDFESEKLSPVQEIELEDQRLRKFLKSPEKWKNTELQDIPLREFTKRK
jgi:hypothetical protein